jgi:hypothetical protein
VVTAILVWLAEGLWRIFRRPILLGSLILGFLTLGIVTLWMSSSAKDWWQDFLLNAGVNLIFVAAVDLLVLGVIARGLLESNAAAEPDEPDELTLLDLHRVPSWHLLEITEALHKMNGRDPERGHYRLEPPYTTEHEYPYSFVARFLTDATPPER